MSDSAPDGSPSSNQSSSHPLQSTVEHAGAGTPQVEDVTLRGPEPVHQTEPPGLDPGALGDLALFFLAGQRLDLRLQVAEEL